MKARLEYVGGPVQYQDNIFDGIMYSINGGNWINYEGGDIQIFNQGDYIQFINTKSTLSTGPDNYFRFSFSNEVVANGNVQSMLGCTLNNDGSVSIPQPQDQNNCPDYCFYGMFQNCDKLIEAPALLSSENLSPHCYENMFKGCKNITHAPYLPAKTLADSCYKNMFNGCTNLTHINAEFSDTNVNGALEGWIDDTIDNSSSSSSQNDNLPLIKALIKNGIDYTYTLPEGWRILDREEFTKKHEYNLIDELGSSSSSSQIDLDHIDISILKPLKLYSLKDGSMVKINRYGNDLENLYIYYNRTGNINEWYQYQFGTEIILNEGDYIYFDNKTSELLSLNTSNYIQFSIRGCVQASGNIQSLLKYENKCTDYCFYRLFKDCTGLITPPDLPASVLQVHCYDSMFQGCVNLIRTPYDLSNAIETKESCYKNMFKGCTYLYKTMYQLPATILTESCYEGMFSECISLMHTPLIFNNINLIKKCFQSMFEGCTSLSIVPYLKYNALAESCYKNMFKDCHSLMTNIELSNRVLSTSCYESMFQNCINLINSPNLPATTLGQFCYKSMFEGCISLMNVQEIIPATATSAGSFYAMYKDCINLAKAPEIKVEELKNSCFAYMFDGCISLKSININFKKWHEEYESTIDWVKYLGDEGIFKMPNELLEYYGDNFIPEGWNVSIKLQDNPVTFVNGSEPSTVILHSNHAVDSNSIVYSKYNVPFTMRINNNVNSNTNEYVSIVSFGSLTNSIWYRTSQTQQFKPYQFNRHIEIDENVKLIQFWNRTDRLSNSEYNYVKFQTSNNLRISLEGNLSSLINYKTSIEDYAFYSLFKDCTSIIDASKLYILIEELSSHCYESMFEGCTRLINPPTLVGGESLTLYDSCYKNMFKGCIALTTSPKLPSKRIAKNCYQSMFERCTSLVSMPVLYADSLAQFCYKNMFKRCTSLVQIKDLPATILAESCYESMFEGCTDLINPPVLPAETLAQSCYKNMFKNCTSLVRTPQLYAETLAESCYESMFEGCTDLGMIISDSSSSSSSVQEDAFILPASNLEINCYASMFKGCTSLKTAPELQAQTLVDGCYNDMFNGCTNLNYVKVLFRSWKNGSTDNWLLNVSQQGTFIKPNNLGQQRGASRIPVSNEVKWSVSNNNNIGINVSDVEKNEASIPAYVPSQQEVQMNDYFINMYPEVWYNIIYADHSQSGRKRYFFGTQINMSSRDELQFWNDSESLSCSDTDYVYFKILNGINSSSSSSSSEQPCITKVYGNMQSMLNFSKSCTDYCFYYLFRNCYQIGSISELDNLNDYQQELSLRLTAVNLARSCYEGMFNGCTSITTAPLLPANNLIQDCYEYMFGNCNSLNFIKVYFTNWNEDYNSTLRWMSNVSSNGYFYCYNELNSDARHTGNISYIPQGWNVINMTKQEQSSSSQSEQEYKGAITFTSREDGSTLKLVKKGEELYATIKYKINDGEWQPLLVEDESSSSTENIFNNGDVIQFVNIENLFSVDENNYYHFVITGKFDVKGNIKSLYNFMDDKKYDYSSNCFYGLFKNCTGLINAEYLNLSLMNLSDGCYESMFEGCNNLETAPILPATVLKYKCYASMFKGCSSLRLIDVAFTEWLEGATTEWVSNVNNTGTFVKFVFLDDSLEDENHIPVGWTIEEKIGKDDIYIDFDDYSPLSFIAKSDSIMQINYNGSVVNEQLIYYKINPSSSWTKYEFDEFSNGKQISLNRDSIISFCNIGKKLSSDSDNYAYFNVIEGELICKQGSDIRSMLNVPYSANSSSSSSEIEEQINDDYLPEYSFYGLFNNCNNISNFSNLILSYKKLSPHCYESMFEGCSNMETAPKLLATDLTNADYCYASMFKGCISLNTMPELSSTRLSDYCYSSMFEGCINLTTSSDLPARILYPHCYKQMFKGCESINYISVGFTSWFSYNGDDATEDWVEGVSSSGVFYVMNKLKIKRDELVIYGDSHIPSGWMPSNIHSKYHMSSNGVVGIIVNYEQLYSDDNIIYKSDYTAHVDNNKAFYRMFYGDKYTEQLDNNVNNNNLVYGNDYYAKGRLLGVINDINMANRASFNNLLQVDVAKGSNNFNTIQFLITDDEHINYNSVNHQYMSFYNVSNSGTLKIDGHDFANGLLNKEFIQGDYDIKVSSFNKNQVFIDYRKNEMQIIYYYGNVKIEFDSDKYVKSIDDDINSVFSLNYGSNKLKKMFKFDKVQINNQSFTSDLISESNNDPYATFNYPFVWDNDEQDGVNIYVSNEDDENYPSYDIDYANNNNSKLFIKYDQENDSYIIRLPFGDKKSFNKQMIEVRANDVDEFSIDGNYELLSLIKFNVLTGKNISQNDYIGFEKIYKHVSKDFYIRSYKDGNNRKYGFYTNANINNDDSHTCYTESNFTDASNFSGNIYLKGYNINNSWRNISYSITRITGDSENNLQQYLNMRFTDKYGNHTEVNFQKCMIYKIAPYNLSLRLIGSTGQSEYTGFYEKYGRFFPTEYIKAQIYAESGLDNLKFKITGDINEDIEGNFNNDNTIKTLIFKVKPNSVNYNGKLLCSDADIDLTMTVTDEAGNESSINSSIRYITKLFRTRNYPLVTETAQYHHKLYTTDNGIFEEVNSVVVSDKDEDVTRSWNEIWWPENHGSPVLGDGSIDAEKALRIAKPNIDIDGINGPTQAELDQYDRLSLNSQGQLQTDEQGRYINSSTGWNTNKTYRGMVNSKISNNAYDTYWIIDNTGNVDFKLEFEFFDFSGSITKLPANLVAPQDGDMLAVYSADNEGATSSYIDIYGNTKYTLKDSTKLELLFILKGSYRDQNNNPFKMINSKISGELQKVGNGFITPSLSGYNKICLVPFTDYGNEQSNVASGFKLKAGSKHTNQYYNYDKIDDVGEFWTHIYPKKDSKWKSLINLSLVYDYYLSTIDVDYQKARVVFNKRMDYPVKFTGRNYIYQSFDIENNVSIIDKPFSYFNNDKKLNNFCASYDDFVDYYNPSLYVNPFGVEKTQNIYLYSGSMQNDLLDGKLTQNFTVNKDIGIITFNSVSDSNKYEYLVPKGRLFADYNYHTYYRLTSDGYGDLYFYGTGVLVPAVSTSSYKDFAAVDLKIVNEGGNTLLNGTLQFLARGYVTSSGVVDTVLDNNRPWDIQQGSTAETVQRTGAKYAKSYSALPLRDSRVQALNAIKSQTCVFGSLEPREHVYVRVWWCIASNQAGTAWIETVKGSKTYSSQISGTYLIF